MPYQYVLLAYEHGLKQQHKDYHFLEGPTSLLTSVFSNANRDPKKKREPYKMEDFFLYQSLEDRNIPSSIFGSAAMELIKNKEFPQWALFAFKALKEASNGHPPEVLAYIGEDAMVLGPVIDGKELKGMFIGKESSYGKERILASPCGMQLKVIIPRLQGKVYAEENIAMHIIR